MRKAIVSVNNTHAGILSEHERGKEYTFTYMEGYNGPPVSLTMPVREIPYRFTSFPAFFDGLLPEGMMLEGLLRGRKIDRSDCFSQLVSVGADMPGTVTVEEMDA